MTFARTETQMMFGDMLGKILDAENDFEERRRRLSLPSPDRLALWPILAGQGILGAALPEEAGGFGGTMRDLAVAMEEIGRKLVVEPVLEAALSGQLLHAGGEDLASLISGETITVLAFEEGFDPFALPETKALAEGEAYRLHGRKPVVRHAELAHQFIATATVDGVAAAFLFDASDPGIVLDNFRMIDGTSAAAMELSNVAARQIACDRQDR